MAHQLEIIDGNAQMAYRASKGKPWHGLGVPVGDELSPADMMVVAGLDWTVSKTETYIKVKVEDPETHREEEKWVPTGTHALIRDTDNKILTEVGEGWNPCQNHTAFQFFHDFVEAGDMVMDTAGSLKGGQIVWALADLCDGFRIFGGDEVKGYLLFSNPHMYGKSIDIQYCMERVVCNNTLVMALSERGQPSVKVNHRAEFDADLVKETLGLSHRRLEAFKEKALFLGSKRYDKEVLVKFFGSVFGESKQEGKALARTAEAVMGYVEDQPGTQYAPGTFWQMYNAVTYAVDHKLGRSPDTRLTNAWFGPNAKKKIDALNLAVKMAEVA